MNTSSGDGRISTNGVSLIFSPLTTADSGSYTCSLSLTYNTPHITIVQRPQQSSDAAITVLSMSKHSFMFVSHILSLSVPQPTVAISLNCTGPLFAGTSLTISCTVTLDSNVNNNERVTIDWGVIPPERYSESPVMRESDDGSYTGRLTISPLAINDDGTTLTCTGIVTGGTETQSASSSDEVTISVEGELTHPFTDAICEVIPLHRSARSRGGCLWTNYWQSWKQD